MPNPPTRLALPPLLGLTEAAPLRDRLLPLVGEPVILDASAVEHLGGLCLQVLLSARLTWAASGTAFELAAPSAAFVEAWSLSGVSAPTPA